MSKKYQEIMQNITVTPELRERILNNIEKIDFGNKTLTNVSLSPTLKKFAALAACLAILLTGALVLPKLSDNHEKPLVDNASGIIELTSIEELSETVGFELTEPNLPFQAEHTTYTAYWTEMAEILYTGDEQSLCYRKGTGTEDVSGDFNAYSSESKLELNGNAVTLKGDNELYVLATWTDGSFAYSISLNNGISLEQWQSLLSEGR